MDMLFPVLIGEPFSSQPACDVPLERSGLKEEFLLGKEATFRSEIYRPRPSPDPGGARPILTAIKRLRVLTGISRVIVFILCHPMRKRENQFSPVS